MVDGGSSRTQDDADPRLFGKQWPPHEGDSFTDETYDKHKTDQIYHIWEIDNHLDPKQHTALLRLQGRKITARQGYQDYFRQQKRQRESQSRFFKPKKREHHSYQATEPNAVVDHALAKVTADNLLEGLSANEAKALKLVFGEENTIPEASRAMYLPTNEIRKIIGSALAKTAKKIAL